MNSKKPFVEFPINLIYGDKPENSFVLPLDREDNNGIGLKRKLSINPRQAQFLSSYPIPLPIKNVNFDHKDSNSPEYIIPKDFKPFKMPGSHFSFENREQ